MIITQYVSRNSKGIYIYIYHIPGIILIIYLGYGVCIVARGPGARVTLKRVFDVNRKKKCG